ncbi:hypothetical protein SLA2020_114420 [Shorea laevis]
MEGIGFGKGSGPKVDPKLPNPFQSLHHPSPPSAAVRPTRGPEAANRVSTPPAFVNPTHANRPLSAGLEVQRTIESPLKWDDGQRSPLKEYDAQTHPRPTAAMSLIARRGSETSVSAKIAQFPELKRTRSPTSFSRNEDVSRYSSQASFQSNLELVVHNHGHSFPPTTQSPSSALGSKFHPTAVSSQRPGLQSSVQQDNHAKLPANLPNLLSRQNQSLPSSYVNPFFHRKSPANQLTDIPKGIRFQPMESAKEVSEEYPQFVQNDPRRPSASPPRLGATSNVLLNTHDSQRDLPMQNNKVSTTDKITSFPVSKRTRSPPLTLQDEVLLATSSNRQDENEREMQAKAKRLARFKPELSEAVEMRRTNKLDEKISANRHQQSMEERRKFVGDNSTESAGDFIEGNASSDFEGLETSSVIVGLCPDMCPESERAERERKGDLDQYERLDGDRNQTSKFLAVKKYNRTAEREASLIRPMPVLQKTIGYLLNLLDQPYDGKFLGIYNFLWDRMRAVRMDLRMQHIFDQEAITMLEQMIRLHIIAMHELCEYTKGEGFAEGFDAHLNIEQMNKTSVELFQMYDDHRKKGINVPTEREFRGYYALLKLDKHPGYKVEPAELSLDLAKMTPEIRQTPEVLFARNIARACRTGNFVAFFRLARKSSYLQACLMHAHFSKLRTQALASLHCSLQGNQGLPVNLVARWLGMEEEEDIESLLEYHGFSIKDYEEPYMVKEGPLLNAESDYPTKCSRLVQLKRSGSISEDVSASSQMVSLPVEAPREKQPDKIYKHDLIVTDVKKADEEMLDCVVISPPKDQTRVQLMSGTSIVDHRSQDGHPKISTFSPWKLPAVHSSPRSQPANIEVVKKHDFKIFPQREMEGVPSHIISRTTLTERSPSGKYDNSVESPGRQSMVIDKLKSQPDRSPTDKYNNDVENLVPETRAVDNFKSPERLTSGKYDYTVEDSVLRGVTINEMEEDEAPLDTSQGIQTDVVMTNCHDEFADAKLKLILRLWRRRSARLRDLREQRQLVAEAALSSLSLGPPIQYNKNGVPVGELDFDNVMRERYEKRERSWSRLNVSDVVAGILGQRNPDAKCLCWKIVLCSYVNGLEGGPLMQKSQLANCAAGSWLFSKLMPSREETDCDLIASYPGMSIWKKWVPSQSGIHDMTCCLSVVKETKVDNLNETVTGASAVLYLVSERIPWKLQKVLLHNLMISIPSGSSLPLLILCESFSGEVSDPSSIIANELSLHDLDKSQVSSFSVVFLAGNLQLGQPDVFFSDEQLRKGLQWLASESPLQPALQSIKLRKLVMSQLSPSLEMLDKTSAHDVGPNHCIFAFNKALDWSLGEIVGAAKANPTSWPCPEINLLEDSSDEHLVVKWYLPSVGWSSAAATTPLECALRECRLPSFSDDISWLHRGSSFVQEIKNQRVQLQNCLIRYLTQSSKMMGVPLATEEACIMLQRSTRLELSNLSYHVVPNWVMIFQRIFNWRLMSLCTGALSSAYVLESHLSDKLEDLDKLCLEDSTPVHCFRQPSLDEVIEVGCSPLKSGRGEFETQAFQPEIMSNSELQNPALTSILTEDEDYPSHEGKKLVIAEDVAPLTSQVNDHNSQTFAAMGESEKINKLLEQCNIIQNSIDEKLSIFF